MLLPHIMTGFVRLTEKLNNVQALRFFAALLVVVYHTIGHYEASGGTWMFQPFGFGWIGVDIFFVISGFIMWRTTNGLSPSARSSGIFLYKRLARIYSGYWPWFFAMISIYFVYWPARIEEFNVLYTFFLIPQLNATNLLAVSWTLSYELYFYGIFALLLMLPRPLMLHSTFVLGAFIIASAAAKPFGDTFVASPLVLEFLMGVWLAAFFKATDGTEPWIGLSVAIVGFVFAGAFIDEHDWIGRVLTAGVGAVGLLHATLCVERKVTAPKWLTTLGDASYALYLCHIPVLYLIRWTLRDDFAAAPSLAYSILVIIMIGMSVAWYKFYEAPLYRMLKRPADQYLNSIELRRNVEKRGSSTNAVWES